MQNTRAGAHTHMLHFHMCALKLTCTQHTAWCSEIGSLTSLDAPELHSSSDVREPISLHQAVDVHREEQKNVTPKVVNRDKVKTSMHNKKRNQRQKNDSSLLHKSLEKVHRKSGSPSCTFRSAKQVNVSEKIHHRKNESLDKRADKSCHKMTLTSF